MFDDDLYKFTMQQIILHFYGDKKAEYRFKNRGNTKFNDKFADRLQDEIENLSLLVPDKYELEEFAKIPFIRGDYVEYLSRYRYDPRQVQFSLRDGDLDLRIKGPWHSAILWEVKLMALISEIYFAQHKATWTMDGQKEKLDRKALLLEAVDAKYADFGTRRRRSFEVQDLVVRNLVNKHGFLGTSNVHLAIKHGVSAVGTMAHEWVQGVSVAEDLLHANGIMMDRWNSFYQGQLGVALTDTFTTPHFLYNSFDAKRAAAFSGVRQDSGDPFWFANQVINRYLQLGINPKTKTIIFSDSLDAKTAAKLQIHCDGKINCAFGIGTNLTNDFDNLKPINMVIKLWSIDGIPVVKLSDNAGKNNGDLWMLGVAKRVFGVS